MAEDKEDKGKAKEADTQEQDDGRKEYALRPGKEHTVIGPGGHRVPLAAGDTTRLRPEQYESFKDKFVPVEEYGTAVSLYQQEQDDGKMEIVPPVPPEKPSATTGAPAVKAETPEQAVAQADKPSVGSPPPSTRPADEKPAESSAPAKK